MAKSVLTDVRLFAVAADLTGASNKVEISAEVEEKDTTNYASQGWKEVIGGLASSEITGEGQWEAGDPGRVDDASWAQLGGAGPWSVCPDGAAVGALAYLTRAMRADYEQSGGVGDLAAWKSKATGAWPLVRGQVAHPPGSPQTATGTGTALQLPVLATGQRLYAALHVLSAAGTTPGITARVESDDSAGFASPTTRLAFDAASGPGGQILRTDGTAVADTWWRVAWTITGTTPSLMFVSTLGIR